MWIILIVDLFLLLCSFRWLNIFYKKTPKIDIDRPTVRKRSQFTEYYRGCRTVWDLVNLSFTRYGSKQATGTRKFINMFRDKKKFGEIKWLTYTELGNKVKNFGSGLLRLGIKPLPKGEGQDIDFESTKDPHTLLIYQNTSEDWITALLGAFSQSIAVATSYATLGVDSVFEVIEETNANTILCDYTNVLEIATKASSSKLENIIYTHHDMDCEGQSYTKHPSLIDNINIFSMNEVIRMGSLMAKLNPPMPHNMAVIMYTSGSTGKPKGVMIRHSQMCASVSGLMDYLKDSPLKEGQETYLAYLPAAHILELCAECAMLTFGARLGYADPKSISSKGACRMDPEGNIVTEPSKSFPIDEQFNYAPGGIQAFRPTFMAAVPKIWDILVKGVQDALDKKSVLVQHLVGVAFAWRSFLLSIGCDSILFKKLFDKLFAPLLGGRQKIFISGGGPISEEIQGAIRTLFGCPLVQGYALTETCCAGTVQYYGDPRNGIVGQPISSVELSLLDCATYVQNPSTGRLDMEASVLDRFGKPYLIKDRTHYGQECLGRGEVVIRGPSVSSGYLKMPEKTSEDFDDKGWFHTGDIAVLLTDGSFKIVDRLKNLIKLRGGEYVAIEAMEKEYSKSSFVNSVDGGIMCYGDGEMDRPIALVQIESKFRNVSKQTILDDLNKHGKQSLARNEKLADIYLIMDKPWTPENNFLTASNKLNRRVIQNEWQDAIDELKQNHN
jgi:long-chain acyl-CoA synthetase